MDTMAWVLLLLTGQYLGHATKPYSEVPAVRQGQASLWHDPGPGEKRDLRYGPGGRGLQPAPPFRFIEENMSGSSPKVKVRDARGRLWQVKFGSEAGADVFASRLAWALGYYADTSYFVPEGQILGVGNLQRARSAINKDGHFEKACFELRVEHPEYLKGTSWSWDKNPFVGTRELQGLKILVMLVSNWDNKDQRQSFKLGSNMGIMRAGNRYLFFVDDWGRSMGNWGRGLGRSTWNAEDFHKQSLRFIKRLEGRKIEFAYTGHNTGMRNEISTADARWLLRYLSRLKETQLRQGLVSCGASPEEAALYTEALRMRIQALQYAAEREVNVADSARVRAAAATAP